MDSEIYGYLALFALIISAVLLFAGSLKARQGPAFLAPKLMTIGSLLTLLGMTCILLLVMNDDPSLFEILYFAALLIFFGSLLFFIGFIAFCVRWGNTGKRRAELLEFTAALSSMREVEQSTPLPTKSHENQPPRSF